MKSLKLMKLVLGTLLAVLATTAQSQIWNPASTVLSPADLGNAQSILYLDDSCNVVAFIVAPDPQYYVFPTKNDRITTGFPQTYQHASACPGSFLDAAIVGAGNPDACKPNVLFHDVTVLSGVTCRISRDLVTTIIVLNKALQPLLIVEGQLANDSAPGVVPATILGRKGSGDPCTPAIPPPCPQPPHTSAIKNVGGVNTCVCQ